MTTTTTAKPSRIDKLLALVHYPKATPAERDTARLRLREMNAACQCSICLPRPPLPQQQAKWVRDYCAMRPESVAWAQDVVQKYRSKNPVRTQDDFWVSPQEVMKQYPSLHADELILVIFLRPTLVR